MTKINSTEDKMRHSFASKSRIKRLHSSLFFSIRTINSFFINITKVLNVYYNSVNTIDNKIKKNKIIV